MKGGSGVLKKDRRLRRFAQEQEATQLGYVTEGTEQATESLMQGYRQAYAQRAAGIAGSYGLQADQLVSEMASQGLDPSILRRMLASQRGASLQQMGEAQGGLASQLFTDLAQLQKGTAGERAAISQVRTEQQMAAELGRMSAQAMKSAGKSQAFGSVVGGALSAAGSIFGGK